MAGTLKTSAYIGLAGGLDSVTTNDTAETVELRNGLNVVSHPLERTHTITKNKTFGEAYGIYNNSCDLNTIAGGLIFRSASYTATDAVSQRQTKATSSVVDPSTGALTAPDGTQFIQVTENMIWLGYNETYSLDVLYDPAIVGTEVVKVGNRITSPFLITPAVISGSAATATSPPATLTPPYDKAPYIQFAPGADPDFSDHLLVEDVTITNDSGDWHSASISLKRFVPATEGCASTTDSDNVSASFLLSRLQMIQESSAWVIPFDYSPATSSSELPDFYSCSLRINLTAEGNPTSEESVEFFPSDSSSSNAFNATGYSNT